MAAELSVVTERLPKSQVGMNIEVPAEVVDATYDRVLNRVVDPYAADRRHDVRRVANQQQSGLEPARAAAGLNRQQ